MRKAFNFYRSYYDVAKELPEKDRLKYLMAILERQFEGVEPKLSGMSSFAYKSQKHSIDAQVFGYESKTGTKLTPTEGGAEGGSVQEKEQEKEKVQYVDVPKFLSWFNGRKEIHTGKLGKFKTLTKNDTKNLKQLQASYNVDDFNSAVEKMFASSWTKETGNQTPTHFLRVENFNRYLAQVDDDKPKFNPFG